MRLRVFHCVAAIWLVVGSGAVVQAEVLFYGGDGIGEIVLENLKHHAVTSAIYDDFTVTDDGWKIEALQAYVGAFENALPSAAEWEIRRGTSEGDGGVLVAAGRTTEFTWTLTGVKGPALFEHVFRVDIADQNIVLPPGRYHLLLRPEMSLSELMAFLYVTKGANGVGGPLGNSNSFLNSPGYNYNFRSVATLPGKKPPVDFRYKIEGAVLRKPKLVEAPTKDAAKKEEAGKHLPRALLNSILLFLIYVLLAFFHVNCARVGTAF